MASSSTKHRGLGRGLDDLIKGGIQKKPAAAPAKPSGKTPSKPAPSTKPAPAPAPAPTPAAAEPAESDDLPF